MYLLKSCSQSEILQQSLEENTLQTPHQDVEPKLSPKLKNATVSSLMTLTD